MNEIDLTINGRTRKIKVEKDTVLLDVLRRDLKLTGAKQSCDRKGLCGACTVIVNNKAVLSCLAKAAELEGAEIITVEGLGTPDNPHLIQEAFVLAGAVQCGFCTPGLIMATKALLNSNPDPDREEETLRPPPESGRPESGRPDDSISSEEDTEELLGWVESLLEFLGCSKKKAKHYAKIAFDTVRERVQKLPSLEEVAQEAYNQLQERRRRQKTNGPIVLTLD